MRETDVLYLKYLIPLHIIRSDPIDMRYAHYFKKPFKFLKIFLLHDYKQHFPIVFLKMFTFIGRLRTMGLEF